MAKFNLPIRVGDDLSRVTQQVIHRLIGPFPLNPALFFLGAPDLILSLCLCLLLTLSRFVLRKTWPGKHQKDNHYYGQAQHSRSRRKGSVIVSDKIETYVDADLYGAA